MQTALIIYISLASVLWSVACTSGLRGNGNSLTGALDKSADTGSSKSGDELIRASRISSAAFIEDKYAWLLPLDGRALFYTQDSGAHWIKLPAEQLNSFSKISFIDRLEGWAISTSEGKGVILRTSDGGRAWTTISTLSSNNPEWSFTSAVKIEFVDELHGWIVETFSVWHTSDGGRSWQEITPDGLRQDGQPTVGAFVNSAKAWVCSSDGPLYFTDNAGDVWKERRLDGGAELQDVFFVDEKTGWIADTDGHLYATADGGHTWQVRTNLDAKISVEKIYFIDQMEGWVTGQFYVGKGANEHAVTAQSLFKGVVLHTSDGGKLWQEVTIEQGDSLYSHIHFADAQHGWLSGGNNLYTTLDGGKTWRSVFTFSPTPQ
jgi:photosystem II stability/assembly factor-like uncharacterized protein